MSIRIRRRAFSVCRFTVHLLHSRISVTRRRERKGSRKPNRKPPPMGRRGIAKKVVSFARLRREHTFFGRTVVQTARSSEYAHEGGAEADRGLPASQSVGRTRCTVGKAKATRIYAVAFFALQGNAKMVLKQMGIRHKQIIRRQTVRQIHGRLRDLYALSKPLVSRYII